MQLKLKQTLYINYMCVSAKVLQLCPILCDPVDCSLPGSSVHEILQARILGRVALPSSRGSTEPKDQTSVSYVSCTGRWVMTSATWEAPKIYSNKINLENVTDCGNIFFNCSVMALQCCVSFCGMTKIKTLWSCAHLLILSTCDHNAGAGGLESEGLWG